MSLNAFYDTTVEMLRQQQLSVGLHPDKKKNKMPEVIPLCVNLLNLHFICFCNLVENVLIRNFFYWFGLGLWAFFPLSSKRICID